VRILTVRILIIEAMPRLCRLGRKTITKQSWLARMLARKLKILMATALTDKMARRLPLRPTVHPSGASSARLGSFCCIAAFSG
jgi:hypothetical protein